MPLQKQAPHKGPLKNISPGAYFRNFTTSQYATQAVIGPSVFHTVSKQK